MNLLISTSEQKINVLVRLNVSNFYSDEKHGFSRKIKFKQTFQCKKKLIETQPTFRIRGKTIIHLTIKWQMFSSHLHTNEWK